MTFFGNLTISFSSSNLLILLKKIELLKNVHKLYKKIDFITIICELSMASRLLYSLSRVRDDNMKTYKVYFYKTIVLNENTNNEDVIADYTKLIDTAEVKAINSDLAYNKALDLEFEVYQKVGHSVIVSFKPPKSEV